MPKIVINTEFGGFNLSEKAVDMLNDRKGLKNDEFDYWQISRDDPDLVAIIEELGSQEVGGRYSTLKVVEIPEGVDWIIQDYDGVEWIAEKHRTWS